MNKPSLYVLRPEQRKFSSNCVEKICNIEYGKNRNSLKDDGISRPSKQLKKKNTVKLKIPPIPM